MRIPFGSLAEYLKHRREVEFSYKGKAYSITNSHHEWHFCCDTDQTSVALCAFSEVDVLVDKVRCIELEGISIEELFNEHPGDLVVSGVL